MDRDGQERRGAFRVPVCFATTAGCDAWTQLCHTRDLSESGAFLIGAQLPDPTAGFSLEVDLPIPPGRLLLRAQVVRIQGASPRGFGLRFVQPGQDQLAVLRELAARWQRAFGLDIIPPAV